jgi:phage protein D
MSDRARVDLLIGGASIFAGLAERLTAVSVALHGDGRADTASISLDDSGGVIVLPKAGAKLVVQLGWAGAGIRPVFSGTVDEVRSTGGRSGGRVLSITAKGFDATGGAKGQQRRAWDDKTVKTILTEAGTAAGITEVSVDPSLADRAINYWSMLDESFLHMGQRLAREIGGRFRVQGNEAVMSLRGAAYSPRVTAAYGINLHSWDIAPVLSRDRFGKVRAPWYDKAAAAWKHVEVETGVESDAVATLRETSTTEAEARRRAEARAASIKEATGEGSVRIEGDTGAVPDAICVLTGARPGVDGSYRIAAVTHSYSRAGGFTTDLDLAQPQDGSGEDDR